jgi:flagellar basal-body rod protein FlgF
VDGPGDGTFADETPAAGAVCMMAAPDAVAAPNGKATTFQRFGFSKRRKVDEVRLRLVEHARAPHSLIAKSSAFSNFSLRRSFWSHVCNSLDHSMDQISLIAASGMRASMQSLDVLSNNMANASTNGYKGDSEFHTVFVSETAEDADGEPTTLPMIQRHWTDFTQGTLEPTNNPLDFGLTGKGFFVVQGPNGPLYTRNGSFQLSASGTLNTKDGYPLLDQNNQPMTLPTAGAPIVVGADGTVQQNGQPIGVLQLVDFKDPGALLKQGGNYYQNESGAKPSKPNDALVQQGKIETSNVNAAHGAVRLVNVMRQFEVMQKAISISNEMGREAIEQVAKI